MGSIQCGAKQAIENCLRVKENEKVVIVTDKETLEISIALKNAAEKRTRLVELYFLEDFVEKSAINCPKTIFDAVKKADVSIYCSSGKQYSDAFRNTIISDLFKLVLDKKIRHAHMPMITKEIMQTGLCVDCSKVQELSKKVYNILEGSKQARITTKKGTDINVSFSHKTKWVLHDSLFEGYIENLPSGNVSAPPKSVEGWLVIDGYVGNYFNRKYGDIEKTPVEMEIEKSRVVKGSVKCENKMLEQEFNDYLFKTDKNCSRIGGFVMGTNPGLDKIINNLLQDEKIPGHHILFGSPSYFPLNKWSSKTVCDSLIKYSSITVDGKKLMKDGRYEV